MIYVSIKPLLQCNIRCEYCNLPTYSRSRLSISTVTTFFSAIVDRFPGERICVRWGGGEPLLMGVEFFRSAVEWQARFPGIFTNDISTNLTLLDERYANLFKENDFSIFTSLDGIGQAHDQQRDSSFERVRAGLAMLKESGIARVFVNTVATRRNCVGLRQVYDFCAAQGFGWNFSVVVPSGIRRVRAEELLVDPAAFTEEVTEIFDDWFAAEEPINALVFSDVVRYVLGTRDYVDTNDPQLTLGPDGDLYSCRLMAGNPSYSLGTSIRQVLTDTPSCRACAYSRADTHQRCNSCYFDFLCNLNHCAYLSDVYAHFSGVTDYLCSCLRPVFLHVAEKVRANGFHVPVLTRGGGL